MALPDGYGFGGGDTLDPAVRMAGFESGDPAVGMAGFDGPLIPISAFH